MVEIPANIVSMADLVEWNKLQEELKLLKAKEMLLRQRIFKFYFPSPNEGTNTVPLEQGWVLKGKYPIDRQIDEGALAALSDQLVAARINKDALVNYKPSLAVSEYRTLTAEQMHLFDQALIIKPGSPALEIALPAKAKAK